MLTIAFGSMTADSALNLYVRIQYLPAFHDGILYFLKGSEADLQHCGIYLLRWASGSKQILAVPYHQNPGC
jgi:hypothetical protein